MNPTTKAVAISVPVAFVLFLAATMFDVDELILENIPSEDSALDKCIKGTTVSALMYLQTQGGHDASSYANAEKRLIAKMESECKSLPKVHLDIRAEQGIYDIPLDREIELIQECHVAGGHWDLGCRFF